ncbi:hypothetical protein AVO42_10200 [Thiomicrospira sp. XS5]|uniref:CobW family GTP-binding protein n=1 Tax=Thiomicrospira sp. XS5 TaxID=1775636 RepID=UPI00074A75D8|nr:GTP-binding protein [Thiomicrospira sp. XS5]KUJ75660.1 hypothetical protein AVO42_10200 [Thiomicrospira sp. XS5]
MAKTYKQNAPIPATLVTGLLGSGKTTAIHRLLQQRPAGENWGLLINEFGEIGIDAATLDADSPWIEDVTGGCICCSAQFGYRQALQKLLQHPLDRILVEPTGLGHPAQVIDTLKQFQPHIRIAGVLLVITPQQLTPERWAKSAVMRDLVNLADTVLLNKTDLASDDDILQAEQLLQQTYPPKESILHTHLNAECNFPPGLVDFKQTQPAFTLLSGLHEHQQQTDTCTLPGESKLPHCLQRQVQTGHTTSVGWQFDANIQFNRVALKAFIEQQSDLIRAKGVLRTGTEWQLLNVVDGQIQWQDMAWRQDSRLELLFETASNNASNTFIDQLETALNTCLIDRS